MNPSSSPTRSTTLDGAGRVVLPSDVRRRLGLAVGTRFHVEIVADRIELTPAPPTAPAVIRKSGRLVLASAGQAMDAASAIRAERQSQASRKQHL